jgi:hypothetical protein
MTETAESVLREILGTRFDELNETTRQIILRFKPEKARASYAKLLELGLTPERIARRAELLGVNPETIQWNADLLQKLGLTPEKIATNAQLLSFNSETIQRNADSLKKLGLSPEKIATLAHLLGNNPETLQRNYEFLRQFLPKEVVCKNAQLLGNASETVKASVQFMKDLGVDYVAHPYVSTTPNCKRKKVLAVARERYGYASDLSWADKTELVEKAKEFIRKYPNILFISEKTIARKYGKRVA